MSIFEAYDGEYSSLTRDIMKKIQDLKSPSGDKPQAQVRHIDGLFSQANDLIKQMEIEVRSHDPSTRKALSEKVLEYKRALSSIRSDYERSKETAQRSNLVGEKSNEQRQRLLNVNDKLDRQNEMIMNAHRTVAETEEVGIEIVNELGRNRDKIVSSRNRAQEFTGITDSARRLLSSMERRDVQQRMVLAGLACVFIIAISITIYFATAGKHHGN